MNTTAHQRNYLPHVEGDGMVHHVVLHLSDSLPAQVLERIRRETARLPESESKISLEEKIDAWMDAGYGSCALRHRDNAEEVISTLCHFHNERLRLYAWVIMPNHAHVLMEPLPEWTVKTLVSSWKKFSATRILRKNPTLPKPLWLEEYWERYIRNQRHFRKTLEYIHENPVKAGLVKEASQWPWSTAAKWREFQE